MNRLEGHIVDIEISKHLSIVSVAINEDILLKAIVIETPQTASYLEAGKSIALLFKETEVVIGIGENQSISLQNKIPGTIKQIEKGTLLSKITLESTIGEITAIISTNAVRQLNLTAHIKATAMIKLNEVMLSEI